MDYRYRYNIRKRPIASTPDVYSSDGTMANDANWISLNFRHNWIEDYINKTSDPELQEIPGFIDTSNATIQKLKVEPMIYTFNRWYNNGNPYIVGQKIKTPDNGFTMADLKAAAQVHEPSEDELLTRLINWSAPNRYAVSTPVMVVELLEMATLFKLCFNNLVALGGSSYLNYNFGWRPLLEDVKTLAKTTKIIESRIREFNSLIKKGGLRRRIDLFEASWEWTGNLVYLDTSYAQRLKGRLHRKFHTEVHGTLRWFPVDDTIIPTDGLEQFNKAFDYVFDTDSLDPNTVWEAIPFSWLIDYFVSIGPTLEAWNALNEFEPKHVCLAYNRTVVSSYTGLTWIKPKTKDVVFKGRRELRGYWRTTHKDHQILDAVAPGFAGLLSEGEAANILALFASRQKWTDFVYDLSKRLPFAVKSK